MHQQRLYLQRDRKEHLLLKREKETIEQHRTDLQWEIPPTAGDTCTQPPGGGQVQGPTSDDEG